MTELKFAGLPMLDNQQILQLDQQLKTVINTNEFELLKWLESQNIMNKIEFTDSLSMFRAHFILYNALYRLQDFLAANKNGGLLLQLTKISRFKHINDDQQQVSIDKGLAEYYLNEEHYFMTSKQQVDELLNNFWHQYIAHQSMDEHLLVLEIKGVKTWQEIKQQYRKLCLIHHPDKGGDKLHFQRIQEAYEAIKLRFKT